MIHFLTLSLLALVISKLADVWTTIRGIRQKGGDVSAESNPLARWLMVRFGLYGGVGVVMAVWCVIVVCCYWPMYFMPEWMQLATAVVALFVAWIQWEVASYNFTRKSSKCITRLVKICNKFR